ERGHLLVRGEGTVGHVVDPSRVGVDGRQRRPLGGGKETDPIREVARLAAGDRLAVTVGGDGVHQRPAPTLMLDGRPARRPPVARILTRWHAASRRRGRAGAEPGPRSPRSTPASAARPPATKAATPSRGRPARLPT